MNLLQLRNEFRRLAGDRGQPPIWPTEDVDRWINEAQREAATRGFLLEDRTTAAVCEVTLLEDQREYLLHPSVLNVVNVSLQRPNSNNQRSPLIAGTYDEVLNDIDTRPNQTGWACTYYLYSEGATTRLLLNRAPGESGAKLYLRVYRLPLADMALNNDTPEIHTRHHDGLVHWVLHRAYQTRDVEGSATNRAAYHEELFTRRFGERLDANVQRKHKRHRATVCRPISC